jgi:hypothetical protein
MDIAPKLKTVSELKGKIKNILTDDEIISLTKQGSCPHYILINPITKEESIWFISSEINEWFETKYIKQVKEIINPKFDFIFFDKEKHKVYNEIPDELILIKGLYELPIIDIRTPSGVYFLCLGKKIMYIGQSVTIGGRVLNHIREGIKDFDRVFFIACPIDKLTEIETALIKHYKPPLNATNKKDNPNKLILEKLLN